MTIPVLCHLFHLAITRTIHLICLLCPLLFSFAPSCDAITLDELATRNDLNSSVLFLEDADGRLNIDDVRRKDVQRRFTRWNQPAALNFGLTKSAYWLKVTLKGSTETAELRLLEIPYTGLDYIDFYAPDSPPVQTGSARPFGSRPVDYRYFIFPFQLAAEEKDFYFRIESRYSLTFDLIAWLPEAFFANQQKSLAMQALYFGELLALVFYNIFLFSSLRDRRFLYYVLFTTCLGFGIFAGNGFGRQLLWRESNEFDAISQSFFICLAMGFGNLFANQITQATKIAPGLARVMRVMNVAAFSIALIQLASLWIPVTLQPVYQAFATISIVSCALVLLTAIQAMRHQVPGATMFMLSWGLLMVGGIVGALRIFDWVPTNSYTAYSVQISSAAELLLLAFLLASLIRRERKVSEKAQRHALAVSEELLEVTRHSEARLESMVRDRTYDLNVALEQQKSMLTQHLRFGELISHEFRNPLSIIESQVSVIKKQKAHEARDLHSRLDEIKAAATRLKNLFEKWIQNDRMMQPTLALQISLVDCKLFLQDLLDRNALPGNSHTLVVDVDPLVGHLSCDKELLEIALINLIDNATKYSAAGTTILVRVSVEPGYVGFSVSDQGIGIAVEYREKVFEDYVRLDTQGKAGLGLGLPLVKKIAEMHLAHIHLDSEPGNGSTFSIFLPDDLPARLNHSSGVPAAM